MCNRKLNIPLIGRDIKIRKDEMPKENPVLLVIGWVIGFIVLFVIAFALSLVSN